MSINMRHELHGWGFGKDNVDHHNDTQTLAAR
jgi:hypothetical protein